MGGTIALEMAQQLLSQGEDIGLLFMIENYNIKTIKWPMHLYLNMANKLLSVWYHAGNLFARNNNAKSAFFTIKAKTEISRLNVSLQVSLSSLLKTIGAKSALDFPHNRIDKAYDEALVHYTPKAFNGKIVLFRTHKRFAGFTDPFNGWGSVAKRGVEMYELPTNPRGSLVEPYVRMLAEQLRTRLDKAIRCTS